jgi:hypothetical protein
MRALVLTALLVCGSAAFLPAEQSAARGRTPGTRLSTSNNCAASLGAGVKSRRTFCDVIISSAAADSVAMTIPAHTGAATLMFDLHNRFGVPAVAGFPAVSYARHEALVRIIGGDGTVLGRAASVREFRVVGDLFDQIGGGGRAGGVKAVAPGPAEAVRVVIPAGATTIGIVGERLRVRTGLVADEVYDAPGRPIAIVSNLRIEYRPAR